jgi:hypothetical protein
MSNLRPFDPFGVAGFHFAPFRPSATECNANALRRRATTSPGRARVFEYLECLAYSRVLSTQVRPALPDERSAACLSLLEAVNPCIAVPSFILDVHYRASTKHAIILQALPAHAHRLAHRPAVARACAHACGRT